MVRSITLIAYLLAHTIKFSNTIQLCISVHRCEQPQMTACSELHTVTEYTANCQLTYTKAKGCMLSCWTCIAIATQLGNYTFTSISYLMISVLTK